MNKWIYNGNKVVLVSKSKLHSSIMISSIDYSTYPKFYNIALADSVIKHTDLIIKHRDNILYINPKTTLQDLEYKDLIDFEVKMIGLVRQAIINSNFNKKLDVLLEE